ncbi:MAG: adenylate/guanylate cyclase domain-containing protein [Desulfobacteraceae bacterium]|jgi:class 3 adenylate cyclase/tetratricopeptide (TPR) repeat protein
MDCPKCQTANPEGKKFCRECGAKLALACPQCAAEILPGDKFCGECGHKLALRPGPLPKEISFDEKLEKIQRYLPKGLTEKILSERDKIEGERKQVTVMFCDMEGFTALVEKLGSETAYGIMDEVYEVLIHKVHDYEGTVNEMTGDGIMALFGAPIALEDAPQRAIRSALAIHREMSKFGDKIKQKIEGIPPIRMRVGIHTGSVVVGTLGNDLRVEFKAVGDTVNLASRVEGVAEPGATCVTEDTFKLTEGFFRFEALGEKQIKGKEEPVKIYRVIGPSTMRTRFDVSAERGLTPFIGRERELGLLMEGFERAKAGRGQAFSIVSEAGVGKSRLLYEFRKAVTSGDVMFLEGRCLSYSRGIAYHPVIDFLKSNFDIRETDEEPEIRGKVKRGLKIIGADEVSMLPYLLELLSLKDSGIDKIPISPEAVRDRTIGAINRIALKGSEIRPLIMAFEDLHWIDKSSEDCLRYLLDSITGARVFLIFTYRPEFVHTWGGRSYHGRVTLNRLSNHESLAMVTHLLNTKEIERNLEELILEKTEGIPLFVEEFTTSLKDLKVIEKADNKYRLAKDFQEVSIPSTIQDVIMARVDSLPEEAKEVLQTGSVIEREFSYELIKRVTGLPEQELLSRLSTSKDSELLYERGIYPQSTYVFKHALTQEVVYESILTNRKKRLHEEIGKGIEDLYKQNIDEHYGVLAEHFIKSENYEKGSEYSKLAGEKAQKAASFIEAIEYAKKRVFCLERLAETEVNQRRIIDARTRLAGYNISLTHHIEAKDAVAPVLDLALKLNYQKRLPIIYTAMGMHSHWVEGDYSEGFRYLNEALEISEKIKDTTCLWFANLFLGETLSLNCEFEKGFEYLKKSLDLGVLENNPIEIEFAKSCICAFNYISRGNIDLAYQTSKESLLMAQESGDIYLKGAAYSSYGMSCYCRGLFDEAENCLLQALSFCEKTAQFGWGTWVCGFLGHVYFNKGEYKRAHDYYNEAVSTLERARLYSFAVNMWKLSIERSKVLSNDKNINLGKVFEYYKNINPKVYKGWAARYIGEILLNIDDQHISEAEDWFKKAIEADKRNGTMWCLGGDYALYAELFKRKGDHLKAKENLAKAIDILKKCGADGWVKKYDEELASLS